MNTAAIDTLPQTTPKGGGEAYFEVLSDNKGKLAVPQFLQVPELLDYDYQDKAEVKTYMGNGKRPIGLTGGKSEITISLTMAASFGRLLNQLCYGAEETAGQHVMVKDTVGYTVPDAAYTDIAIRDCITIHFGRCNANSGVLINGVAGVLVPGTPALTGQYAYANGKYTWAKVDIGKAFAITFISKGTTIVQTGRIIKLTHDVKLFSSTQWTVKNNNTVLLTQDAYNPKVTVFDAGHYQGSTNGVLTLNATALLTAGLFLIVTHFTDGQTCTSKVGTLPASDHQFFVDPPSAASYVANDAVVLLADALPAMTGVAVGGELVADAAAPVSGKYKTDGLGHYQFALADAGDTVRIKYMMDYYYVVPMLRDLRGNGVEADFYKLWGVRNALGKPLQRVAWQWPLVVGNNQYALDERNGACYFDNTNAGDTFYFDAEFVTEGGSRIEVKQEPIGTAPVVRIALNNNDPDQELLLTFEQAMCEGMGVKTKTDDAGDAFKFTFKCAIDRVTQRSHAINMSS